MSPLCKPSTVRARPAHGRAHTSCATSHQAALRHTTGLAQKQTLPPPPGTAAGPGASRLWWRSRAPAPPWSTGVAGGRGSTGPRPAPRGSDGSDGWQGRCLGPRGHREQNKAATVGCAPLHAAGAGLGLAGRGHRVPEGGVTRLSSAAQHRARARARLGAGAGRQHWQEPSPGPWAASPSLSQASGVTRCGPRAVLVTGRRGSLTELLVTLPAQVPLP